MQDTKSIFLQMLDTEKAYFILRYEINKAYEEWEKKVNELKINFPNISVSYDELQDIFPKPTQVVNDKNIEYNEFGDALNQPEEFTPPNERFNFSDIKFGWLEDEIKSKILAKPLYSEVVFKRIGNMPDEVKKDIELHALHILGRCNNPYDWEITAEPQKKIESWKVNNNRTETSTNQREIKEIDNEQHQQYWDNKQGLVYGMVQSGKTASMVTLMGLADSAGFKLLIVLSGDKTSLRNQTQKRINDTFNLDYNGSPMDRSLKIQSITRGKEDYEANLRDSIIQGIQRENTLIVCIKKNSSNLSALVNDLNDIKHNAQNLTPGVDWKNDLKALIIDDEADYASQNTNRPGNDPTTINQKITELRELLPQNTYVAYTATPQACIGADTKALVGYPKHFIWLLDPYRDKNNNTTTYLGIQEFFTSSYNKSLVYNINKDAWPHWEKNELGVRAGVYDADGNVNDVKLKDEEEKKINQFLDDEGKRLEYCVEYKEALADFVITCSIRWYRHYLKQKREGFFTDDLPSLDDIKKHNLPNEEITGGGFKSFPYHAMMFNLAYINYTQQRLIDLVVLLLDEVSKDYDETKKSNWKKDTIFKLRYEKQIDKSSRFEKTLMLSHDDLEHFCNLALRIARETICNTNDRLYVLNSTDEGQTLNYDSYHIDDRPKKASIIIGGLILGRGLTVENLSTSVFIRSQSMSLGDTNLQMCRWFGHKKKDIDLQSVYMQEHSKILFENIAHADKNLRSQFKEYLYKNIPPECILLQLQNSPLFKVTSPNKSRFLTLGDKSSFSGKTELMNEPRKDEDYIENYELLTGYLETLGKSVRMNKRADVYYDVDIDEFNIFFESLKIHDSALIVTPKSYLKYLKDWKEYNEDLPKINIAVFGKEDRFLCRQMQQDKSYKGFTGGKKTDGSYLGDKFVDKDPDFHKKNYNKKYFKRQKFDEILVAFYLLNPEYVNKEITPEKGDQVKMGQKKKPVVTYAISTPVGGPLYRVRENRNQRESILTSQCLEFED